MAVLYRKLHYIVRRIIMRLNCICILVKRFMRVKTALHVLSVFWFPVKNQAGANAFWVFTSTMARECVLLKDTTMYLEGVQTQDHSIWSSRPYHMVTVLPLHVF